MSESMQPLDPALYDDVVVAEVVQRRPRFFMPICVIAIALGGLGLASSILGLANLIWADEMQQFGQLFTNGDAEFEEAAEQMQGEILEVQERYFVGTSIVVGTLGLVASGLLAGGIGTLRLQSWGRVLLMASCTVAIIFELLRSAFQIFVQMEVFAIVSQYFEQVAQSMRGAGPVMLFFFQMQMYFQFAVTILWLLAKLVFFYVAVSTLQKPETVELFPHESAAA